MKKFITFLIMLLVVLCVSCANDEVAATDPNGGKSEKISDYQLTFSIEPKNNTVEYNYNDELGVIRINFIDSSTDVKVTKDDTTTTYENISDDIVTNINAYSSSKFTVVATRTDQLGDDVVTGGRSSLIIKVKFIPKAGYEFATPSNDKSITLTVNVDKLAVIPNADIYFTLTVEPIGTEVYNNMHIIDGAHSPGATIGPASQVPPEGAATVEFLATDTTTTYKQLSDHVVSEATVITITGSNNENFTVTPPTPTLENNNIIAAKRDRIRFDYRVEAKPGYEFEDGTTSRICSLGLLINKPAAK